MNMKQFLTTALTLLVAVAMQAQISFTASEWATAQSLSDGAAVTSYTSGDVTVTFAQGTGASAPSYNNSQSAVAAVSGNTMTISAAEGYEVTSAVLTMYREAQATNLAGATWSTGSVNASGTAATWTGKAEEVTVNINNTARFVSFSITLTQKAAPIVEDESTYNDTTVISIAEWIEDEGFSNGESFTNESVSKEGKTITLSSGVFYNQHVYLYNGTVLSISAPYKMHKILLHFVDAEAADHYVNGGNYNGSYISPAQCSTGALQLDTNDATGKTVAWIGSTAGLSITNYWASDIDVITIISDATDNQVTVRFYGLDGQLLKTEPLTIGSSATAPTINHECFSRWDKAFTNVHSDLEIHAVATIATEILESEWNDSKRIYSNNLSFTKDGYTVTASYVNRTTPDWYWGCICFTPGDGFTITGEKTFRGLTITCRDEANAQRLAASTCSTGSLSYNGNLVYWTGEATSVTITRPSGATGNFDISAFGFPCEYYEQVPCTVIFVNENGQEIGRQTVLAGESVTPPAAPASADGCKQFMGWDTDLSKIRADVTVHPLYETKKVFSITAYAWNQQQRISSSQQNELTQNGITIRIPSADYNRNNDEPERSYIRLPSRNNIDILSETYLRNFTFVCLDESAANNLAEATFSNGTATRDSIYVYWTGGTDSLRISWISRPSITGFEVLCETIADHTVVFLDRNGGELSRQQVPDGGNATAPANPQPANECYTFTGWDKAFTKVLEDLTISPIFEYIEDCVPEGYVKVTFTDLFGNVIDEQLVLIGSDVTAPVPPTIVFYQFTGWSAPLTNIQTSQTIQAQYTFVFDPNDPNILTVAQAKALLDGDGDGDGDKPKNPTDRSSLVVVKGIVTSGPDGLNNGKLSFRIGDDGTESRENLQVTELLNLYQQPFTSPKQIMTPDTVYIVGYVQRDWWDDIHFVDGYLAYILRATYSDDAVFFNMPDGATLYDFDGNGVKEAPIETALAKDIQKGFIEDVNRDGKPDIYGYSNFGTWLSKGESYELQGQMLIVPNMDLNRDGRPDYLVLNQYERNAGYYGDIMYQLPDGTFQKETMQAMTWDEFVAQMTPEEQDQYNNPQNYSLGDVSRYTYAGTWGGASLARAPRRNPSEPKKAPGMGSRIEAPTKAIDLNGDGLIDLINEKTGIIYTNMTNGKWVWTQTNGAAIPADLNNDGITDFIFPGSKLYTAIFNKATNQLVTTTLYQNATVDDLVHVYDFDQDGDIDILATFSSAKNSTGYAYTCFFVNDGNGNFTQQPEQNYGSNNLWFSALQDIDGDGYYDLLAFRGDSEIVWLKGNNMQFAAPVSLAAVDLQGRNLADLTINAEDLNNDGKAEIWISGLNEGVTDFYALPEATTVTANNRPTAPAAPTLSYNNGLLTITWGNGSDDKTATADLTYALRIGTTAGGHDILAAHANTDGSRRNFLDGNMGRTHTYTIDLRTYAPATMYVAVQAVDAQHSGSVWSQEATIAHTYLPVDFTLDRTTININETVELTYTALPEGYIHTWTAQDGSYIADGSKLTLSFTSGGEKTITHTITAPDHSTVSATAKITVLPAGVGEPVNFVDEWGSSSLPVNFDSPMADYNFDGRLDGIQSSKTAMVVMEGVASDQLFTQAAGLWNTNMSPGEVLWYDYNRDGASDLLLHDVSSWGGSYGILYHDATQPTLTAQQEDDNLLYFFEYNRTGTYAEDKFSGHSFYSDMTHNGLYDNLMMNPEEHYQLIEMDGNGGTEWIQFTVNGDADLFQSILQRTVCRFRSRRLYRHRCLLPPTCRYV